MTSQKTIIRNTTRKTIGIHTSHNRYNAAHFPEENEWLNKYIVTHISMSQEKQRDLGLGVWETKQKMRILSLLTYCDKSFHHKLYTGCSYLSMLGLKWIYVNSSPPSAPYMRQWIKQHCSDNGLSSIWCQAIIWTNVGILLIGPLGTNISEI